MTSPNWNQSGLAELRFPDGQCPFSEIRVFMLQASRLTQAQPGTVEHQEQRGNEREEEAQQPDYRHLNS